MFELKLGVSRFRATSETIGSGTDPNPPTPSSFGPDNSSPVKRELGCGSPAFMDDPLTLVSCAVSGRLHGYQRWQRVAIQSEAFLTLCCICVHRIAALGLDCMMKTAAEALNKRGVCVGGLFVFNKLSMKESERKKDREIWSQTRKKENICVFSSPCCMCFIIKMHKL